MKLGKTKAKTASEEARELAKGYRYDEGVLPDAHPEYHRALLERASAEGLTDRAVSIQTAHILCDILAEMRKKS